jgi:two-component system invasion response regulator UvrY
MIPSSSAGNPTIDAQLPVIKVIIADDHAIVREGLRRILASDPDILVVGEAADAAELLGQMRRRPCDVVILDITMPGRSGLDLLRDLDQDRRLSRALVLSMHPEDQLAIRALKAGAAGYLNKACAPDELVRAIRRVYAGGKYVSPWLAEKLASELRTSSEAPLHAGLSDREFEVMRLLAMGSRVKEIAEQLSVSVKSISTYRARLLRKMQMRSNAQLVRYAIEHGLAETAA